MKNNVQLQAKILHALKEDTKINVSGIKVDVSDGIVTFEGVVDCYWKKIKAEDHAKMYDEVKMIINEIRVELKPFNQKSDKEVADAVIQAFKWHNLIPVEKVEVNIINGWLTVSGHLEEWTHKEAVEEAVGKVEGVLGFTNEITIKRKEDWQMGFMAAKEKYLNMASNMFGGSRFAF